MQSSELYKTINKMDCQMHRLSLNCPIHNHNFFYKPALRQQIPHVKNINHLRGLHFPF